MEEEEEEFKKRILKIENKLNIIAEEEDDLKINEFEFKNKIKKYRDKI